MIYTNRRNNKVLKTFKDYLVPLIIVLIILLLIINNIFFSKNTWENIQTNYPLKVYVGTPDTEAYIIYSWWNKIKLENEANIYKNEKLSVANWNLNIKDKTTDFVLNKLWELKYNEDWSYTLYSSDLWVKTNSWVNIEMRYAKVSSNSNSIFSLSQNEVASTIYILSWIVDIKNLAWKTTTLQKWDKLVIMRNNANDENLDLSLLKEQIDDYIKTDDWFIKNNWNYYLSHSWTSEFNSWILNLSWTTSNWSIFSNNITNSYISFDNLFDEQEVNTNILDINWTILSDNVSKIEINNKDAIIDKSSETFNFKWFKLESKINDLVYKIYDEWNKLLTKWIITIYSINNKDNSDNIKKTNLAQVENYPIISSPLYQIISPKQNPYITSDNIIRIEWTTPPWIVEKIVINNFELKKFPKFGSYWSYFANNEFWNLKDWVNIYKIQYFDVEWKLIHENNFTIIKETKKPKIATWIIESTSSWILNEIWTWITQ